MEGRWIPSPPNQYDIEETNDTITVRVCADLAPLFPNFGLALEHSVVREGEAQVGYRHHYWGCQTKKIKDLTPPRSKSAPSLRRVSFFDLACLAISSQALGRNGDSCATSRQLFRLSVDHLENHTFQVLPLQMPVFVVNLYTQVVR